MCLCYFDMFIVYKLYFDVMFGNRFGVIDGVKFVDIVDDWVDFVLFIVVVDEVYMLFLLIGFEVLLCGKEVYIYGLLFYVGWGFIYDVLF